MVVYSQLRPAGKIIIIKWFPETFSDFFRIAVDHMYVAVLINFKYDILRGIIYQVCTQNFPKN